MSYRDLAEMMREQVWSWITRPFGAGFKPTLENKRRLARHWKSTHDSWRVDETYIKIKTKWFYLYCAIDSGGQTLDFRLSRTQDAHAAYTFFCQVLQAAHVKMPRVINVNAAAAYPIAFEQLQKAAKLPPQTRLRRVKYLNNIIEQDHRFVKRRTRGMLGFKSLESTSRTLEGIEVMQMLRKGQLRILDSKSIRQQIHLIHYSFGIAD